MRIVFSFCAYLLPFLYNRASIGLDSKRGESVKMDREEQVRLMDKLRTLISVHLATRPENLDIKFELTPVSAGVGWPLYPMTMWRGSLTAVKRGCVAEEDRIEFRTRDNESFGSVEGVLAHFVREATRKIAEAEGECRIGSRESRKLVRVWG